MEIEQPTAPATAGGAAFADLTGAPEDNAALETALDAKADGNQSVGTGSSPTFAGVISSLNKYKEADESVVESTDLQDDDDLSATLSAGRKYEFTIRAHANIGEGRIKVAVGGTATYTNLIGVIYIYDVGDPLVSATALRIVSADEVRATNFFDVLAFVEIKGTVEIDTGGTFALRWAQQSSNVAPTAILRGSSMIINELQ